MDFSYANETVCWVHVGDSAAQTQLRCARMPGLKGFVDEHTINISLSLHRKSFRGQGSRGEGREGPYLWQRLRRGMCFLDVGAERWLFFIYTLSRLWMTLSFLVQG